MDKLTLNRAIKNFEKVLKTISREEIRERINKLESSSKYSGESLNKK